MSPTAAAEFTKHWPALEVRLRSFLAAKRVSPCDVDDLVQESAARLLSLWHKVDAQKPIWPLTVTIALNLVRDRHRKPAVEVLGDPPELSWAVDAEHAGLARIELGRVLSAMKDLTESQRTALLQVLEPTVASGRSDAADKMLRMRARRRLANAIGRASAGISLRLRRASDGLHALLRGEGITQALACATCLFVTTAGAGALYPTFDDAVSASEAAKDVVIVTDHSALADHFQVTSLDSGRGLSPRVANSATAPGTGSASDLKDRKPGAAANHAGEGTEGPGTTPSLSLPPTSLPDGDAPLPHPPSPESPGSIEQPDVHVDPPSTDGDAPVQAPVELPPGVEELAENALGK